VIDKADLAGVHIMRWPLIWFSVRRILVGMICGAGVGAPFGALLVFLHAVGGEVANPADQTCVADISRSLG
jgi:hypothetical protein